MPGRLGLWGLWVLESLGLRLGFRRDSLIGMLYSNPSMDFLTATQLSIFIGRNFIPSIGKRMIQFDQHARFFFD